MNSEEMVENYSPFITVYESIGGWKAVCYCWTDEDPDLGGFWEPWQTGYFGYATKEPAILEAKAWAEAEELEYREP